MLLRLINLGSLIPLGYQSYSNTVTREPTFNKGRKKLYFKKAKNNDSKYIVIFREYKVIESET